MGKFNDKCNRIENKHILKLGSWFIIRGSDFHLPNKKKLFKQSIFIQQTSFVNR